MAFNRMSGKSKIIILLIFIVLTGIQLIPIKIPENKTTLTTTESYNYLPDEIHNILNQSCFDCHSNFTNYPWYSKIAPASWLVARDVRLGRENLNFSEWDTLSKRKKIKQLTEILETIEEKEMPLPYYLIIHRNANLSEDEKEKISQWVSSKTDSLLNQR